METLDIILYLFSIGLAGAFIYIIASYVKGLKGSPRELYLVYLAKVLEYTAYGSMNLGLVLFLSSDVGLSDIEAGAYIGVWSMSCTVVTMLVGPIADTFGIKRTLLLGTTILLFARFFMPLTTNIYALSLLAFLPLGVGMAMKGPVLSVAIKKFTSKETAALGFGLFYTLLNVGWAAGAWVFDFMREHYRGGSVEFSVFSQPMAVSMSTYQLIFCVAFVCTVINWGLIALMRDGVELDDETCVVTVTPSPPLDEGNRLSAVVKLMKQSGAESGRLMKKVFSEKAFWIFLGMLSTLIFVRLVFYHFHYTFPKYAIRVLGEDMKIGSIFGVLNPALIIFLTPLFATLTKKIRSYSVLLVGTFVSSISIFIATMPERVFEPLVNTWVGELIFVRWLEVPEALRQPMVIGLVLMVIIFSIGEAIWSPRLMQFTAEIAPKGKEGSYIALAYLPYFGAKFFVGPLSGWLVATYTPEGAASFPQHYMVWVWIGGIAVLSPLSLLVFRKLFLKGTSQAVSNS